MLRFNPEAKYVPVKWMITDNVIGETYNTTDKYNLKKMSWLMFMPYMLSYQHLNIGCISSKTANQGSPKL